MPKKQQEEKETMQIQKEEYNALVEKQKALEQAVERLTYAASKGALAKYDERYRKEKLETIVKISTLDGKLILGWDNMVKNIAEINPMTGRLIEDQIVRVRFENGETEEMSYIYFVRRVREHFIKAKVLSEKSLTGKEAEKYGDKMLTVETLEDKPRQYKIGVKFVN